MWLFLIIVFATLFGCSSLGTDFPFPGITSLSCQNRNTNSGFFVAQSPWVSTRRKPMLTLKVLVTTIDAQCERMGDVGSARYETALLPPCPTIRVKTQKLPSAITRLTVHSP